MALGSKKRDYTLEHKTTMKNLEKKGYVKLWECSSCGRKNLHKYGICPRCHQKKGE